MTAGNALSARQRQALEEIGVDVWVRRTAHGAPASVTPDAHSPPQPPPQSQPLPPVGVPPSVSPSLRAWQPLREAVAHCTSCVLHKSRKQTVFGVGNEAARWMIIGEAPGAEEDRQGEPFVGPAGQLLNEMLRAVGVRREDVFIANILKCRPPDNRDPKPEEVAACATHLAAQLELVSPKLILAVGRIAAQSLLQQSVPVGRLRGRAHAYGPHAIPLVVTYHPAYLLRSPAEKRKSWDDLRLARTLVAPRDA